MSMGDLVFLGLSFLTVACTGIILAILLMQALDHWLDGLLRAKIKEWLE